MSSQFIYLYIEFEVTKFKFIKWRNISYFKCIQMEYVFIAQKVAMLYSLFHPCKGKQAVDCSGRQPFLATRRSSPSAAFVKNSKFWKICTNLYSVKFNTDRQSHRIWLGGKRGHADAKFLSCHENFFLTIIHKRSFVTGIKLS